MFFRNSYDLDVTDERPFSPTTYSNIFPHVWLLHLFPWGVGIDMNIIRFLRGMGLGQKSHSVLTILHADIETLMNIQQ